MTNKYPEDLEAFFGTAYYFELQSPKANKGIAFEKVAKELNLNLDKTISFGDQINDISLAQKVGYSVALKNAIPELKSVASNVTKFTNKEDGVARFIIEELGMNL